MTLVVAFGFALLGGLGGAWGVADVGLSKRTRIVLVVGGVLLAAVGVLMLAFADY